jgi:hypothetical protein
MKDSGKASNIGGIQIAWDGMLKEFSSCKATGSFSCSNCENRQVCTACPGVFFAVTGNPEQIDPFYCQYAKRRQERIVELRGGKDG